MPAPLEMLDLVRRTNLQVSLETLPGVEDVWRCGADAVTLDLRRADGGALGRLGRKWIRLSIRFASYGGADVFLGVAAGDCDGRLEAGVWPGLTGLVLYGAECAAEVADASAALAALEDKRGIAQGSLEILPVLRSARGVWNVREIVRAKGRVRQAAIDEYALLDDLGIVPQLVVDPLAYARGRVIVEAIAAGVQPLGLPFVVGVLPPELQATGIVARNLGFKGALLTNGLWASPINDAFSPSPEDVEYYAEVRRVFAAGVARGTAAVPFRGRMIDVPVDEWAKDVLRRAERCSARDAEKCSALRR